MASASPKTKDKGDEIFLEEGRCEQMGTKDGGPNRDRVLLELNI